MRESASSRDVRRHPHRIQRLKPGIGVLQHAAERVVAQLLDHVPGIRVDDHAHLADVIGDEVVGDHLVRRTVAADRSSRSERRSAESSSNTLPAEFRTTRPTRRFFGPMR
jgi:hypothetical protein